MNEIVIILGPTSSGKTSLALSLCAELGGEIISADSRQIYKDMDVGTGKIPSNPTTDVEKKEKRWVFGEISVWGYDLVSPDEFFSSYDFAEFALNKIRNLQDAGKKTFLVGGTGFYIDMVTGRIKPSHIKPDFELREELEALSLEQLQTRLKKISPQEFEKIDKNNPARLIRAIEKSQNQEKGQPLEYLSDTKFIFIGLTAPREYLYERVDTWADKIWENGLLDETRFLIEKYPKSQKLSGLVYKEATAFLKDQLSKEEAIQKTKYSLHAYIRRQQTYFKKIPNINWIDISRDNKMQTVYNVIDG